MILLDKIYIKVNNDEDYLKLVKFSVAEGITVSKSMSDRIPSNIEWFIFNTSLRDYDSKWYTTYSLTKGLSKKNQHNVLELKL